jgi:DNA-binding transcriptional MocR family regulator
LIAQIRLKKFKKCPLPESGRMANSATTEKKRERRFAAKAEHGTSVTTAFRQIRELIVHGRLSPGTWIVESDLCARLHMSRTPVRGALYLLQREGYVQEHRNASKSRILVTSLTKEDANELYSIIGRIEGLADKPPRYQIRPGSSWRKSSGTSMGI